MAVATPGETERAIRRPPRINRSKTVSTKLTEAEFTQVERLAGGRGQWLSEWVRDVLLSAVQDEESQHSIATFVFLRLSSRSSGMKQLRRATHRIPRGR
jgi:hypothetical protein